MITPVSCFPDSFSKTGRDFLKPLEKIEAEKEETEETEAEEEKPEADLKKVNRKETKEESVESIVLRHSARGMDLLAPYLKPDYCQSAAEKILSLPKGTVFLATGFFVKGHAETDGPPGTLCLAAALRSLGYTPVIVTDEFCRGLFEEEQLSVLYIPFTADAAYFNGLLERYQPVCLISIERCGRNEAQDYANMRGCSIAAQTAPIDLLFELALHAGFYTVGIGDGGNEIGMGNLKEEIKRTLRLRPCIIPAASLILATTSNWGAYALSAALGMLSRRPLLLSCHQILSYLEKIVAAGCVDGVSGTAVCTVDGFPLSVEQEIVDALTQKTSLFCGQITDK